MESHNEFIENIQKIPEDENEFENNLEHEIWYDIINKQNYLNLENIL